ncbi:MAG: YggT family protein [Pseudomonadota bacterium]
MEPFIFLIRIFFQLYIMVILFRFLLQLVRADFYNPLSQFTVKLTNPVLIPLRKIIPGYGGVDNASLVFAATVILIKIFIINLLKGISISPLDIFVFVLWGVFEQLLNLVLYVTIIGALLSWLGGAHVNPMAGIFYQVSEPFVRPIRRLVPAVGGFDLSPMFLIIGILFLKMLILYNVQYLAFASTMYG